MTDPSSTTPVRHATPTVTPGRLRPWQRLSVRLAAFFAALTFLAVGAVGTLTYTRQQHEVEDSVGTQLLNIARVAALDPRLQAAVAGSRAGDAPLVEAAHQALAKIQDEALLTSPIMILTALQAEARTAGLVVASSGAGRPGDPVPLAAELVEPMGWTLGDGVARYT